MKTACRGVWLIISLAAFGLSIGAATAVDHSKFDNIYNQVNYLRNLLQIQIQNFENCTMTAARTISEEQKKCQSLQNISNDIQVSCGREKLLKLQAQTRAAVAEFEAEKARLLAQSAAKPSQNANSSAPRQNAPSQAATQQKKASSTAEASKPRIVRGNWAASCAERSGSGGLTVVCQRYGGFTDNRLPEGCADTGNLVCQNRSLCSLAAELPILAADASPRLQSGIESCPGHKRAGR